MPITITRARVKEKCAIADATHDTTIDNLIAEMTPVIEYIVKAEHVADAALATTLNLGATEVVCGEFLAQKERLANAAAPSGGDTRAFDPTDPGRLVAKGWKRLRPYLKVDPPFAVTGGVRAGATMKQAEDPL